MRDQMTGMRVIAEPDVISEVNMKTITLSSAEVAVLRDMGWLVVTNKSECSTQEMDVGEIVGVMEPWYQLQAPQGAYATDLPPRYIYETDRTAEPYKFHYQPPDTMPIEAVKRRATVAWVDGDMMRLDLISEQQEGKDHTK